MAELIEARIETIAAGGAGLARIEGKPVFIKGAAAGERLVCRITKDHRSWAEAEPLEILDASPDRAEPCCGVYGKCGGCNLQHLGYKAQLAAKTAILKDAFVRIGGIHPPEPKLIPSDPWEYRNRMQFHAARQNGKTGSGVLWGLKPEKSAGFIPLQDCPVADPGIRKLLCEEEKKTLLTPLGKDRFTVYSRGDLFLIEGGISRGKTRILDQELALDASLFFQSNGAALEKLIADLLAVAAEADRSLPMADLFCGVGVFAAFLGKLFPRADLVEENKAAAALARGNFAQGDFFAQRGEEWIKHNNPRKFGFIIVDPPRQGLDQSLSLRLAADGPPMLAYVSCDPATLARDSKILTAGNYTLTELRFYDFYPQTSHIESLAVFRVCL
ncbi:MAG: TRAM domain-containing protein [Treponema sp.]|jgi:23S rRNA (uracil1939-C5)-methyltransferase|nr:TRAM domain-containing protein [Treponema sp.]